MLSLGTVPAWVLPGARFDLDYANQRYYGGGVSIGASTSNAELMGTLVAGNGTGVNGFAPDQFGVIQAFGQYAPMITSGCGLWAQGNYTNSILQCRDQSQTQWTKSNMTAAHTATGADNKANSATRLTATGANATSVQATAIKVGATAAAIQTAGTGYVVNEVVTLTGGTFSSACKIKVLTVSGGVPQTININAPGAYSVLPSNPVAQGSTTGSGTGLTVNLTFTNIMSAYIERVTGTGEIDMSYDGSTWVDITSQINSNTYTLANLASTTSMAGVTPGFRIVTSGDAINVDFAQFENNGYVTTPLVTTTAAVARGTDEPHIGATTGQAQGDGYRLLREIMANGGPWSMRWEVSGNTQVTNIMSTDAQLSCGVGSNGGVANFLAITGIGTVSSANSGTFGLGNVNKATYRVNGNSESICLNGGNIATVNGSALMYQNNGLTHMGIGNIGSGTTPLDGYIKRLTFWDKEITDGQMIEFTR